MDARQIKSRKKIEQALAKLLETKSLDELSIEEIALKAGVSRPTFYRNYAGRQAILDEAIEKWQDELDIKIEQVSQYKMEPSVNLLAGYFRIVFDSIDPENHLLHLAIRGHAGSKTKLLLQERGRKRAMSLLKESYGHSLGDNDMQFIATFTTAALDGVLQNVLQKDNPWDIETTSFNVAQLIHLGVDNFKPFQTNDND
ncbi:TetR/AcrR family transcriptional regulator [Pseudocolwellia sp. HL-MZ19]|uniref:TetR/AcrR family transcriptional regulator n=2 Tax=unclassified Pseudocolwellia TaxID=2848178 RepID=UPI003CF59D1C